MQPTNRSVGNRHNIREHLVVAERQRGLDPQGRGVDVAQGDAAYYAALCHREIAGERKTGIFTRNKIAHPTRDMKDARNLSQN